MRSRQAKQEPADQPAVTVKQPSDVSSRVLGIGSTVLAGGRAFLGQGFAVMLFLFFFLVSIREHLESDESPVIRLCWSDSQERRDVDT